jgi:hypothetical protein
MQASAFVDACIHFQGITLMTDQERQENVEKKLAHALTEFLLFFLDPRDQERKRAALEDLQRQRKERNDGRHRA